DATVSVSPNYPCGCNIPGILTLQCFGEVDPQRQVAEQVDRRLHQVLPPPVHRGVAVDFVRVSAHRQAAALHHVEHVGYHAAVITRPADCPILRDHLGIRCHDGDVDVVATQDANGVRLPGDYAIVHTNTLRDVGIVASHFQVEDGARIRFTLKFANTTPDSFSFHLASADTKPLLPPLARDLCC